MSRTGWTTCLTAAKGGLQVCGAAFVAVAICLAAAQAVGHVEAGPATATVTVNNAGDDGIGGCTKDECTFREAINFHNSNFFASETIIKFDPEVFPPDDETYVILWEAPPKIYARDGITIDGSGTGEVIAGFESVDGGTALDFITYLGQTMRDVAVRDVEISAWVDHGIRICPGEVGTQCTYDASNIEISGVTITGTDDAAILVRGVDIAGLSIDGLTADTTDTAAVAVVLQGGAEDLAITNSTVTNSYTGFWVQAGTLRGVDLQANDLSMTPQQGINLAGFTMTSVTVSENQLTDTGGVAILDQEPGSDGVTVESNTVVRSSSYGISLDFEDPEDIVVDNNVVSESYTAGIQVNATGGGDLARVRENELSGNGQAGFTTGSGLRIVGIPALISRNQISGNSKLGIDLVSPDDPPNGVTPNDVGDADNYDSNPLLNFPIITSSDAQTVRGTTCNGCIVELFVSDNDPSGHGEGAAFIAEDTANAAGQFAVSICGLGLMQGAMVTTTATMPNGSTSEFSENFELEDDAGSCPSPTPGPTASPTPTPTPTPGPTNTPSGPTPTATPGGPTPTLTPTPAPGQYAMGDNDCDGDVDSVDALVALRVIAALPVNQQPGCPELGDGIAAAGLRLFGDTDCDGDIDAVDALRILRHVAALPISEPKGCPLMGTSG